MSSDKHTSDEESSSGSDASSDSGSGYGAPLIDLEAEESGADSDESDTLDYAPDIAFPQFTQLPPELRRRIWEVFCPDLVAKARVLNFRVAPSSALTHRLDDYSPQEYWSLADQTEELRAMLATHQESRSIAVKVFPDELHMEAEIGDSVIRFNKKRDVVYLHAFDVSANFYQPGFEREVLHAAVALADGEIVPQHLLIAMVKRALPNLQRLYLSATYEEFQRRKIRWCGTDYVHRYVVQTYQKEIGLGEDVDVLYCWPDVDRHPDFAKYSIPNLREIDAADIAEGAKNTGVHVLPMVEFEFETGMKRMEELRAMKDTPVQDESDEDSDEDDSDGDESQQGTDLDEYESEGIDDADIEEREESEDEIIPTSDAGRFSSPEISDGDEVEEVAPVQRSRKRKVVSDSEEDEPQTKRVRSRAVVDSDDDEPEDGTAASAVVVISDEDNEEPQKRSRRSRAVSESDEEEEDVEIVQVRSKRKSRRADTESEDDENSDDESESASDEDEPPKRISLAERLRRAREENPVSGSEEDDDEEDEDEDDEDEEEGGLLDIMADEDDDDEDEDEDDAGW
ncbi:zinc finger domain-containing protein [Pochonia chlamydosporia 170]|uniref:Zinc finger domain-containing protein n=1 Tax=Pochonia chlamydosporia 170 TaxID=1380566 RepID=A0A179F4H8_METCM|nr:zinc finger domain-containing protein [Pochonia chlamydosporia 170]OAQ60312.1 zinc finger domain-containing protein [Pochonia chlamydosporia 170]